MSLELLVCLAVLVFLRTRGAGASIFLRLPSTVLHELAHWFVAFVTRSWPDPPSVFPKKVGRRWELGHVAFIPGRWTAALVALAPLLLLGPAGVALLVAAHQEGGFAGQTLLFGTLAAYLLDGCMPSVPDWVIALKHPLGLPLAGGVSYFAYMWALGSVIR